MNFDILMQLENILDESNSWEKAKERADAFIVDSRINDAHHLDNIKEDNEQDESDNIFAKAKKELESEDSESESVTKNSTKQNVSLNFSEALDYKKFKKLLNQFRSSKSLDDVDVDKDLKVYFEENLSKEEKFALYTFIKGLNQITLGDVSGEVAHTPSMYKIKISKQGATSSEKKKSIEKAQQSKEDAENLDTSPIKIGNVGESIQDKSKILEVLRKNNA